MDGQFHGIQGELAEIGITLNVVARGEHLPEIEHHVRTIKERVRCAYVMLPFKKISCLLNLCISVCFGSTVFQSKMVSQIFQAQGLLYMGPTLTITNTPNLSTVPMYNHTRSEKTPWQQEPSELLHCAQSETYKAVTIFKV